MAEFSTKPVRWRSQSNEEEESIVLKNASAASSRSSIASTSRHTRSMSESTQLPPAVAVVQPELLRTYVHSKKINNYLVGNTLGEGSFAKVKEALHTLVGEKVAMKIIDKKKALQDPYVAKNFRREAKLLQMVRHPNILQLYEVIETDTSFYLITDLCSGGELMNYIYKKNRLDEEETHKFMQQIVSAIDHLHRAGIIHRDLKVENMLLDSNMDIKIIDFGLSNEEFVESESGHLHCNTQCGSPAYAAPELLGHKEYGKEVDIWSIGVNMYAMLTGHLPYTVEPFNITALHAKMLENKMNPIPDYLSTGCKDLLLRLLRPNPTDRITMSELMQHAWMNKGHSIVYGPAPFPNMLQMNDIAEEIVDHMVHILKVQDSTYQLKQELLQNRATSATAIYNLLLSRLVRYQRGIKSSSKRRKSRNSANYDKDDSSSTTSTRPQRSRAGSRKISPASVHPTLEKKETSLSTPSVVEEVLTAVTAPTSCPHAAMVRGRRKSVPPAVLAKELAEFNAKKEEDKRKQRQAHTQRPSTTSALPEVRSRKTSAPNAPSDYSTQNDKEVILRNHQHRGGINGMMKRRQSVPAALANFGKDMVDFEADYTGPTKYKSTSLERSRQTNSALPRINKFTSLPREAKHLQHQGATIHRIQSMPQEEEWSATGRPRAASLTRNIHSYPVSLSHLAEHQQEGVHHHQSGHPASVWSPSKNTKTYKFHRVPSGLNMRPLPSTDGAEEVMRRERRRKVSPRDNCLPALSPTEHYAPAPVRFFAKSNQ